MTTSGPASHTGDTDLRYLRRSFVRHLAADRRSAATRTAYGAAVDQLEAFLAEHGLSKTQKTPPATIGLAQRRLRDWRARARE